MNPQNNPTFPNRESAFSRNLGTPYSRQGNLSRTSSSTILARSVQVAAASEKSKDTYFSIWETWRKNAQPEEHEARDVAVARLQDCFNRKAMELNLSGINLSSLPKLPHHIENLRVDHNQLTELIELPASLKTLHATHNLLKALPALPDTLEELYVDHNQLKVLSEIPASLNVLCAEANPLTHLPTLPLSRQALDTLWQQWVNNALPKHRAMYQLALTRLRGCQQKHEDTLNLSSLKLQTLPELPSHIKKLCINNNNLTELPQLPTGLKELVVKDNQLTKLPDLPVKLEKINVSGNQLTCLSALPTSLQTLSADNNHLKELLTLPASLKQLSVNANKLESLPNLPDALEELHAIDNWPRFSLPVSELFELPAKLKALNESWQEWVDEVSPEGEEYQSRITVLNKLQTCLIEQTGIINLSGMNLTSVPEFPPQLILLHLNDNKLETLPVLPKRLEELNVNENRLEVLPLLPKSLTVLDAKDNLIKNLPALPNSLEMINIEDNLLQTLPQLPVSLITLNVNKNKLTELPALPTSLSELNADENRLTKLPPLPNTLRVINVHHNHLTELPALPEQLKMLDVEDNRLTQLPTLPRSLSQLYAANNRLTAIPRSSYINLRMFDIENNRLTDLPIELYSMPNNSVVDVSNNPLRSSLIEYLQIYTTNRMPNQGVNIHFTAPSEIEFDNTQALLQDVVAEWFTTKNKDQIIQKWSGIANEENAAEFSQFLGGLKQTVSARNVPTFNNEVTTWLNQLSDAPALRALTFAVALDASATCEDRVILTWNNMQDAVFIYQIERGDYDNKLLELMPKIRETYRLVELEKIAHEKTEQLNSQIDSSRSDDEVDEIEVYLAYQTQLRDPLKLTSVAKEMRFFDVSYVTQNDLKSAEKKVKELENKIFPDWLAQWFPWQKVLERIEPEGWEKAQEKRFQALENGSYEQQVKIELEKLELKGDAYADAKRTIGRQIMETMDKNTFRQLTKETLVARKTLSLLAPQWPIPARKQKFSELS